MCPEDRGPGFARGVLRRDGSHRSQATSPASTASAGPVWRAKYRLPDGRQVQRTIGPAWTERGRPPAGYFTKRTAEAWLRDVLDAGARRDAARDGPHRARRSPTPAPSTCATSSTTASASRRRCATTRSIVRNHLLPPSAQLPLEDLTRRSTSSAGRAEIGPTAAGEPRRSRRSSCLPRRHGAGAQASTGCRSTRWPTSRSRARRRGRRSRSSRPRRSMALVRAADVRAGRGDLPHRGVHGPAPGRARRAALARRRLRRLSASASRASYADGQLTTPKSGKVRSVPMAPEVAEALARLGQRERLHRRRRPRLRRRRRRLPRRLGAARRYKRRAAARRPAAAALPRPAPHLRHAHDRQGRHPPRPGVDGPRGRSRRRCKYLHYVPRPDDAALVGEAFAIVPGAALPWFRRAPIVPAYARKSGALTSPR